MVGNRIAKRKGNIMAVKAKMEATDGVMELTDRLDRLESLIVKHFDRMEDAPSFTPKVSDVFKPIDTTMPNLPTSYLDTLKAEKEKAKAEKKPSKKEKVFNPEKLAGKYQAYLKAFDSPLYAKWITHKAKTLVTTQHGQRVKDFFLYGKQDVDGVSFSYNDILMGHVIDASYGRPVQPLPFEMVRFFNDRNIDEIVNYTTMEALNR